MSSEIVWNAFYLHALLLHHCRRKSTLELPHGGAQSVRFSDALKARNNTMVGIGQPQWAHACDDCEKMVTMETEDVMTSGKCYLSVVSPLT